MDDRPLTNLASCEKSVFNLMMNRLILRIGYLHYLRLEVKNISVIAVWVRIKSSAVSSLAVAEDTAVAM